jgi:three-Cys-motif partner protein
MSDFFERPQTAAVLKHGILKGYLAKFVGKTGTKAEGGRVVFIDGYAGAGEYGEGTPGSPLIAATIAENLEGQGRNLVGVYVEQDKANYDKLVATLKGTSHECTVLRGSIEEHLDKALEIAGQSPLLVFIDPFGLGVSFDLLARIFHRSRLVGGWREGPPTEAIINFIYGGYSRPAGWLRREPKNETQRRQRETMLSNLDVRLGGDYWREIEQSGEENRAQRVAAKYRKRLLEKTGVSGWFRSQVPRRWNGPPIYELLLLTQFPNAGFWAFNQATSLAFEKFYEHCERVENAGEQGILGLDSPRIMAPSWVAEIRSNLEKELAKGRTLVPSRDLGDVFGRTAGLARETHLRTALKELFAEGKTTFNGVGKLERALITPP